MGLQVQALEQVGVKSSSQDPKLQPKIKKEKECACCFWSVLLPELLNCGNFRWFKSPNSKVGSKRSTDIRGSTRSINNINAGLFVLFLSVCVLQLIVFM